MTRRDAYPKLSRYPCKICGEHFTVHGYNENKHKRCEYCRSVCLPARRAKRASDERLCANGCGTPVESRSARAYCPACKEKRLKEGRAAYNAARRGKTAEELDATKRNRKGQGARFELLYDPSLYPMAKGAEIGAAEYRAGVEQEIFEPGTRFYDRLTRREIVIP